MKWWKWIGLAGLAGVAATGAVVSRDERRRNSYSAEDVRERLHDRAQAALVNEAADEAPPAANS